MSQPTEAPTPRPTREKPARTPLVIATFITLAMGAAAFMQNQAAGNLKYENGILTTKLESTQADLERTTTRLDDTRTRVLDLTAQLGRFDPEQVTQLEQALAAAEAQTAALHHELTATQGALAEREAEVAELANNILPPPPAAEVLAPPPLYADATHYGDPHVSVDLDQYLTELLTTLADDSKAPQLATVHPLGILYDLEQDLLLQGTVGDNQRYRVTEWHTLNDYQDIILDSLVIIDAPEGTNATTRVQQALTNARGASELNDQGHPTWEAGTKTITLHTDPRNPTRVSLHINDAYKLPDMMQVYNRQ